MKMFPRYVMQAINYAVFMAMVWYFSIQPPFRQLDDNQAVIAIAFSHSSRLREPCRQLTQEELSKLAPNMRLPMKCPRERAPVTVEFYLDGELVSHDVLEPPGFHKDQGVDLFRRFEVTAEEHRLRIWMNDDVNTEGPTYRFEKTISLAPEQLLLVDFDSNNGGFYIN